MSAVVIARFDVKDADKFADYMTAARDLACRQGAESIFSGSINRHLHGLEPLKHALIVRFPDVQAINAWFDSNEYRRLAPLRDAAADMTIVSYG